MNAVRLQEMNNADRNHIAAQRLARAMGWAMAAFVVLDYSRWSAFAWVIHEIGLGQSISVSIIAYLAESVLILLWAIMAIRLMPLFNWLFAIIASVLAIRPSSQFFQFAFTYADTISEKCATIVDFWSAPLIAWVAVIALWRTWRVLYFDQTGPFCAKCGYDLRACDALTCSECGIRYNPLSFYRLNQQSLRDSIRAVGWIMVAYGATTILSCSPFMAEIPQYLSAILEGRPAEFTDQLVVPSVSYEVARIIEGAVMVVFGTLIVIYQWRLFTFGAAALLFLTGLSAIQYYQAINSDWLEPSLPALGGRITWFSREFKPLMIGMLALLFTFRCRRHIAGLNAQQPMCGSCGCVLGATGLACPTCTRQHSPKEFFRA